MAIDRKIQKIFGGSLSPSGNIAVYGSKKAGSPTFSDNVETLQSTSWLQGIMGATSPDKAPYVQDLNSIFYVITKQLAYLFQSGVAEWDSQTEYFANKSFCQHGGCFFKCLSDNTNKEPEVSSDWETYWLKFDFQFDTTPTEGSAKAVTSNGIFEYIASMLEPINSSISSINTSLETVVLMPNFNSLTNLTGASDTKTVYAPSDGWIFAKVESMTYDYPFVNFNGVRIWDTSNAYTYGQTIVFPIKSGESLTVRAMKVDFYPYR